MASESLHPKRFLHTYIPTLPKMQHAFSNPALSSPQLWLCRFSVLQWFDCSLTEMWFDSGTPRPAAPSILIFIVTSDRRTVNFICSSVSLSLCRAEDVRWLPRPGAKLGRSLYPASVQENACCRALERLSKLPPSLLTTELHGCKTVLWTVYVNLKAMPVVPGQGGDGHGRCLLASGANIIRTDVTARSLKTLATYR